MAKRDSQDARRRLYEFAVSQGGYFTATQARAAGYPKQLQHYHAARGNWVREDRGIYRLWEWPQSSFDDLIQWTLWSGGAAVASHQSAMAVHEISDLMPAKIHLTVPPGFRKKPPSGIVIHRGRLEPDEIERREGFRVTAPLRTLIDAAKAEVDPERLSHGVLDAIRKGLVTDRHIDTAIASLAGSAAKRLYDALQEARRAA
ncbi:MAG TPA: type IV toxin-antitoxin system AbiEi family antitoxin domain-containing protein [Dissulfurispiraceae bacterium]|nr:type IV toxin-antitoxin system AbiEi family antitoxin domain-containing protein [Dissulfurispiraceae bacterium]